MNMKLFFGLNDRLITLWREENEIWFKERPWYLEPVKKVTVTGPAGNAIEKTIQTPQVLVDCSVERKQNELEQKKTLQALNKLLESIDTTPKSQNLF